MIVAVTVAKVTVAVWFYSDCNSSNEKVNKRRTICEKIVEVFMDDFSIYGKSFDDCLSNLERVLQRCC